MDALTGKKGSGMAKSFLEMAASKEFTTADSEAVNAALRVILWRAQNRCGIWLPQCYRNTALDSSFNHS